jgi:hypothetical protein
MYKLSFRSFIYFSLVLETLFFIKVHADVEPSQESQISQVSQEIQQEITPRQNVAIKVFPDNCSELIGSCDYYLCRESKNPCNTDGYFVSFGFQYCNESLTNLIKKVSPIGEKWLVETATCLQQKLEDLPPTLSCKQIHTQAIKTHDQCYSGNSFCSLPMRDIGHIFKMIYPELSDWDILKEGIEVLKKCTGLL